MAKWLFAIGGAIVGVGLGLAVVFLWPHTSSEPPRPATVLQTLPAGHIAGLEHICRGYQRSDDISLMTRSNALKAATVVRQRGTALSAGVVVIAAFVGDSGGLVVDTNESAGLFSEIVLLFVDEQGRLVHLANPHVPDKVGPDPPDTPSIHRKVRTVSREVVVRHGTEGDDEVVYVNAEDIPGDGQGLLLPEEEVLFGLRYSDGSYSNFVPLTHLEEHAAEAAPQLPDIPWVDVGDAVVLRRDSASDPWATSQLDAATDDWTATVVGIGENNYGAPTASVRFAEPVLGGFDAAVISWVDFTSPDGKQCRVSVTLERHDCDDSSVPDGHLPTCASDLLGPGFIMDLPGPAPEDILTDLTSDDSDTRMAAGMSVMSGEVRFGPSEKILIPRLIELLQGEDSNNQLAALALLGTMGPDAAGALPAIRGCLNSDDRTVRAYAEEVIQLIESPGSAAQHESTGPIGPDAEEAVGPRAVE